MPPRDAVPLELDGAAEVLRRWLSGARGAGWLIDADRAHLIAANAQGARRLGVREGRSPSSLDAAMPALRRLREMAEAGGSGSGVAVEVQGERREALLFWTANGAEWIDCEIAPVPQLARALLVREVACSPATTANASAGGGAPCTCVPSGDGSALASDGTAAEGDAGAQVRDDAAILREIARRIRAGQRDGPAGRTSPRSATQPAPAPVGEASMSDPALGVARQTPAVLVAPEATADSFAGGPGATPAQATAPCATHGSQDAASGLPPRLQQVDVSRLAHELKTPLSAIVAAAEIMRDERFGQIGNERYRGYASDIHDSARHALSVINVMLGQRVASSGAAESDGHALPAGMEQRPQQLQFAQIDLNALVEGSVSAMAPLAEKGGLRLSAELALRLPHVIADSVSLKQILLNLLTNSVKFTGAGGRIAVRTRHCGDNAVEVSVTDTGAGMSDAAIRQVLDPDAQPPRPPAKGGGLGIGLPLVHRLAIANGATVAISSREGEGTDVVLSFPASRVVPV